MSEDEFIATALSNPVNRIILARLPDVGLHDAWLVSGALFQTVWNALTGRPLQYGIRDYDVFYFDPDLSWAAEDTAITRASNMLYSVDAMIEIRNQARVHLWYEAKFGTSYPPLARATDGIDRFLMNNAQVGMRFDGKAYEVYAPRGFDDIARLIVRPNRVPNFQAARYYEKAERWKALWPEITVLSA